MGKFQHSVNVLIVDLKFHYCNNESWEWKLWNWKKFQKPLVKYDSITFLKTYSVIVSISINFFFFHFCESVILLYIGTILVGDEVAKGRTQTKLSSCF